jgi:hypothetical protein
MLVMIRRRRDSRRPPIGGRRSLRALRGRGSSGKNEERNGRKN